VRFYRNHYVDEQGESNGYAFFRTKKDAERAWREAEQEGDLDGSICAEPIEVNPTRGGIVAALNTYAAHPDNG